MSKYAVMIVDDEPAARTDLKTILKHFTRSDFEVIAEAASTEEAIKLFESDLVVDVIFLDIHIQTERKHSGIYFAYMMKKLTNPPLIVFMTGYAQDTSEVMRAHPDGYLEKPLENEKVDSVLAWIRKIIPTISAKQLMLPAKDRIRISVNYCVLNNYDERERHTEFFNLDEVILISKNQDAGTIQIHLSGNRIINGVTGTISSWAEKFQQYGLIKIHKSHLVYLDQVRGLKPRPGENGVYKVSLRNSSVELPVGPEYLEMLREKLKTWTS